MSSRINKQDFYNVTASKSKGSNAGRTIYVAKESESFFKELQSEHTGKYHLTELWKGIHSLNSNSAVGHALNSAHTARQLVLNGVAIEYYLHEGDVFISRLKYDDRFQKSSTAQQSGVYKVQYGKGEWKVKNGRQSELDLTEKWTGGVHHAAISGRFSNKETAGRQLIKHIGKAYNYRSEEDLNIKNNHYSLFWTNKKEHKSKNSIDTLAALFQQASERNTKVNWLVHGDGARTFSLAVEHLKDAPTTSTNSKTNPLSSQKVFFSNPVGVNIKNLEESCKRIGLDFHGAQENKRNLRNRNSRNNVYKEIGKIAMVAGSLGTTSALAKSSGVSGVEKAANAVVTAVESLAASPSLQAGVGVVATTAGFIYAGVKTKDKLTGAYRAVKTMTSCTFGSGDQHWYENDESLIEDLARA